MNDRPEDAPQGLCQEKPDARPLHLPSPLLGFSRVFAAECGPTMLAAVPTSRVSPTRRFADFPIANVSREEGLKMSNRHGRFQPTDVRQACQFIRAHWTSAQRRERRLLAVAKRRELMHRLAAGEDAAVRR